MSVLFTRKKINVPAHFTVTAHTGAMKTKANSVASAEKAAELGADIHEADLHFLPDGTAVASHNEVKSGEVFVSYEDILGVVAKTEKMRLNIDVKSTLNISVIPEMLKKYGISDRAFFTGLEGKLLEDVMRECPEMKYYLNRRLGAGFGNSPGKTAELVRQVRDCGAIGINMNFADCTPEICRAMHENGLLVSVWTVNETGCIKRMLRCGVDNITTKRPDRIFKIIEKDR